MIYSLVLHAWLVGSDVINEAGFNVFYNFRYDKKLRDRAIVRELIIV